MIAVDRDNPEPYYLQVYKQLAADIEQGLYRPGEQLPSLRSNAALLGVSRNTIEQAYQMLTQEGYVNARPGSGYVVNQRSTKPMRFANFDSSYKASLQLLRERADSSSTHKVKYDFAYDAMDPSLFPYAQWTRIHRDVLLGPDNTDICRYADKRGLPALREQIAQYLMREEDIQALPEQILVLPNTRVSLMTVLGLFMDNKPTVAIEDPCFPEVVNACHSMEFPVYPYRVYPDNSWQGFVTNDQNARLLVTTPFNQYPTNASMTLSDKQALVEWAEDSDAYIVEDNYCREFHFGNEHPPSLHALDTAGRVISMGTFSKSLAPSLCTSYLVLPPKLMMRWLDMPNTLIHTPVPWPLQATLAQFMNEGLWYQHLRKIQNAYRSKYRTLVEALDKHLGDKVSYLDYENGLHVLIKTNDDRSSSELLKTALKEGVRLYPTEQDFVGPAPEGWNYVLLGYSAIPLDQVEEGIQALAQAWL